MSSTKAGKNIQKAFEVVFKTYESVQKLIDFLQTQATEKEEYICYTDRFLRWKSDKDIKVWALTSFILVFQSADTQELENEWRNGPVYVLEINLEDAVVHIARFDYADINSLPNVILSQSQHWLFWGPLHSDDGDIMVWPVNNKDDYEGHIANEAKAKRYWGLKRIKGFSVQLTDITAGNAYEKVFGGFDSLADK